MRDASIARNYAEAALELARRAGSATGRVSEELERWGRWLDDVATAVQDDDRVRRFLESPKVSARHKNEIIGKALEGGGQVQPTFIRFLQSLVTHRRQMLVAAIAAEYHHLVDVVEGRLHAAVTVARPADDAERSLIATRLSKAFGKEVIAHYYVNPAILGGLVVRVGDTVLDGSSRRRLGLLKARMLAGR